MIFSSRVERRRAAVARTQNAIPATLQRGRIVERRRGACQFGLRRSSLTIERDPPSLFLFRARIETRNPPAFRARLFVDDGVDQRRLARADRLFHRVAKL